MIEEVTVTNKQFESIEKFFLDLADYVATNPVRQLKYLLTMGLHRKAKKDQIFWMM